MTIAKKTSVAATALFAGALFVMPATPAAAQSLELSKPLAGSTMFFADRYATAYYLIDNDQFKTVVTVAPGPEGQGNPMQFSNALSDGESAEYSVGGYGPNSIKVKLRLHRTGDTVKAEVLTEAPSTSS
ncbi:MAG: hypothetical protein H6875_12690 [Hyphomicrobiaceae bacterium]|nr:hypothetical protein [Hyphomicrobiaceae bacterium]